MKFFPFVVWLTCRITGNDTADSELQYRRLFTWVKLYCRQNFFFWAAASTFFLTVLVKSLDSSRCLSAKNLVMVYTLLLLFAIEIDFIAADRHRRRYPFFYQSLHSEHLFRKGNTHPEYLKFKGYLFFLLFFLGGALFTYFELRDKARCSPFWILAIRVLCLIFLVQTILLMVDALVEGKD